MKIDFDSKEWNSRINDAIDQGMHSIDQGLRRIEEVRGQVGDSLRSASGDLQKTFSEGKSRAIEVEKVVENHVRQHPWVYVAAGVGLGFVLAAKIILTRRRFK